MGTDGKPPAYVGIDPGRKGAAALLHPEGILVERAPADSASCVRLLKSWQECWKIRLAAVEQMVPWKGILAAFTLGEHTGMWLGILAALGIPHLTVRAQAWQRRVVDPKAGSGPKARALATASRLFPEVELGPGDDGMADAMLIAFWARRQIEGAA